MAARGTTANHRRLAGIALCSAALLILVALAGLGTSLHASQARARHTIENRFAERAKLSAALTESLFASTTQVSQDRDTQLFSGADVGRRLSREAGRNHLTNLVLLRADGSVIGHSTRTPAGILAAIERKPAFVRAALAGQSYALSDVLALRAAPQTIQFAQPFGRPTGRRVLVTGMAPRLLTAFVSAYLAEIPDSAGGHAYVLDGRGTVLGGSGRTLRAGQRVPEPGLLAASAHAASGRFGNGGYFAASPVKGSGWHVVLTARQHELLRSVNGASVWVPWLLFAAFGLVAGAALVLVARVLRGAERLRHSQERYALVVDGSNDGIWDRDFVSGAVYFSPRWKALLGFDDDEIANHIGEWRSRVHPDDEPAFRAAMTAHIDGQSPAFASEHRMRHRDGSYRWFLTRGVAIRNAAGEPTRMAGSMSDITTRKAAEELLRHAALHDALTGLPNRTLFLDRLEVSLARAKRDPEHRCAVLFMDLDRFKIINDSFSHAVGDELLVALGRRLGGILRPDDTIARGGPDGLIARLGGDEFTILLDNLDTPARAADVARRIQAALQEPFRVQERELFVSVSIGIAVSQPGSSALDLMRNADIAMYDAKRQGAARWSIFTAAMHEEVREQIELESDLRASIEQRRLRVVYQPVVSLTDGEVAGFEALARWPSGDAVAPSRFIGIAEDTGLIADLGKLVLELACDQLADWRRRGVVGDEATMSINVSGRQLTDPHRLVGDVRAALDRSGLPPRCLRLEITESTVIGRPDRARLALDELARLGVVAEIDDFGTGYASLTVLQSFPGDTLKIDRSFISAMHDDDSQTAIVCGIVALAHNLGMHVVAEGIEDRAQLSLLRSIGCAYGQGYLFAAPAAAAELEPALEAWDPARFVDTPPVIA